MLVNCLFHHLDWVTLIRQNYTELVPILTIPMVSIKNRFLIIHAESLQIRTERSSINLFATQSTSITTDESLPRVYLFFNHTTRIRIISLHHSSKPQKNCNASLIHLECDSEIVT